MLGPFPVAGLVRRTRRIGDLSQRQMARRAGVAPSTVARLERGVLTPSLELLQRLLATAGLYVVAVDADGHVIAPMEDREDFTDGAGRRYPAHLDTIVDPGPGDWWGDTYGLCRPPETFHRDRARRDARRRRSQWEVRVAQHRRTPEPPDPRWEVG
jgi:transcriptional regulator with XRE-family HTH domain